VSARNGFRSADAMLRPDGSFVPGSDPARYAQKRSDAHGAERMAYVCAATALVFAAAAGVLGYLSRDERGAPVIRF
jgi:hypothetical protein